MIQATNAVSGDGTVGTDEARPLGSVGELRRVIGELDAQSGARSRAGWALDDMEDELRRRDPDRDVMASRLWRLTELLKGSGFAVEPGTPLYEPIAGIAAWVGPLGRALLMRLG